MSIVAIVLFLVDFFLFLGCLFYLMYLCEEEEEKTEVSGNGQSEPEKNEEK